MFKMNTKWNEILLNSIIFNYIYGFFTKYKLTATWKAKVWINIGWYELT